MIIKKEKELKNNFKLKMITKLFLNIFLALDKILSNKKGERWDN